MPVVDSSSPEANRTGCNRFGAAWEFTTIVSIVFSGRGADAVSGKAIDLDELHELDEAWKLGTFVVIGRILRGNLRTPCSLNHLKTHRTLSGLTCRIKGQGVPCSERVVWNPARGQTNPGGTSVANGECSETDHGIPDSKIIFWGSDKVIRWKSAFLRPGFVSAEFFHQLQRFVADMVFDAFAVDGGRSLTDAQSQQKLIDDFVTALGEFRKAASFICQRDWRVGFGIDVAIPLHACDRSVDRHMAHGKMFCQIPDAAFAEFEVKFGNGFDVVLRQFGRVVAASSLVAFGSSSRFFHRRFS